MRKRTWHILLRGNRNIVVVVSAVCVVLISSLIITRPAHAEFFAPKKAVCSILSFVFGSECNSTGPQQSSNNNAKVSPQPGTSPVPTPQNTQGSPSKTPLPTLDLTVEQQTVSIPDLPPPLMSSQTATRPNASMYASVAYGAGQSASAASKGATSWVRPTSDGWYLLGVAWYWWIIGALAACVGAMALGYKRRPLLVK